MSFMEIALAEAYRGVARGDGGPFGACIVRKGEVLAKGHNEVLVSNDPTRHAEICAIQRAARRLKIPHLLACDIYSTTEPCVMCFAAINWAQMRRVYFGTTVRDARKLGFNELVVSNRTLRRLGSSPVEIIAGVMKEECRALLRHWSGLSSRKTY